MSKSGPQFSASTNVETYQPTIAHITRTNKLTDVEILLELRLDNGQPLGHGAGQFVQVSVFGVGEAPYRFVRRQRRLKRLSYACGLSAM